jgi:hypothetical protein
MRQTLKVGNVATMISGMLRVFLAKLSVGSLTNWIGISSGAEEGMNLMQQIISTSLGWDKKELKKRLDKIEKDKDAPSKEQRDALKAYMDQSRPEQEECRRRSQEQSMSIVSTILALSSASPDLSEKQHTLALEYLSLSLAVRDRNKIIDVLCHNSPDHLTQAVRDGVAAYDPMIRQVHQAVDLSATVGDFQAFMDDMFKVAKPKKDGKPASVEDFVQLLHSHMGASHRFLHQVAKNGKEVTLCPPGNRQLQKRTHFTHNLRVPIYSIRQAQARGARKGPQRSRCIRKIPRRIERIIRSKDQRRDQQQSFHTIRTRSLSG